MMWEIPTTPYSWEVEAQSMCQQPPWLRCPEWKGEAGWKGAAIGLGAHMLLSMISPEEKGWNAFAALVVGASSWYLVSGRWVR